MTDSDLTEFVVTNAVDAARRVLDTEALEEGERTNARRARDLPGLRRLIGAPVTLHPLAGRYRSPEPPADHHDVSGFTCRSTEQSDWLRRRVRQSAASGTTRVFVVTDADAESVLACYGW